METEVEEWGTRRGGAVRADGPRGGEEGRALGHVLMSLGLRLPEMELLKV